MECPPRLKHRCNRSTDPGSWQSAGSSIMPKHVVLAHLAFSLHAKKALTHCLCRQVKTRQWSAPLASSTGATEARILSPRSRSLPGCFLSAECPPRLKHRYNRSADFFTHSKFDTFTSSCLACHVVSESFDRSDYCSEMRSPRFLSCLRWEFRN